MSIISNRFGQSVPDVFIGNIRISKGYDSLKERENTRHNRVTSDQKVTDRYNDDFETRVKGGEGSQLIVTVNLYIKEVVDSSNKKTWFNNNSTNKKLKIRIAQSLSSGATREISRSPIQLLPGGQYDKISKTAAHGTATSVICKDLDINNKPSDFRIENYLTTQTDNYRVYDVPYQIIFSIPNDDPSHLSYFAVCYYDPNVESLGREKRQKIPLLSSLGKMASEQVIRNNKLIKTSRYYSMEKNGSPYFGPIHQKENGTTITGLSANIGPNDVLTPITVPNIKTTDYRTIDKFKSIDISFKENDKDAIKAFNTMRPRVTYNKKNDDVFFTDLYLNRRRDGTTNLIFGVKMEKIFRNYSHYAKLFNNPDDTVVSSILAASKVRKLRITRRRIDENRTTLDRLNGKKMLPFSNPDGSYDEHVVVEIFNRPLLTKDGTSNIKGSRQDSHTKEEIGTIDKIDLSLGAGGDVLFIQVDDKQISKITEGNYQYGIELEIEDRTQNYLISKLAQFEKAIKNYGNTANVARMAGYNQYNKKYTEAFMSLTTVLNFESGRSTPWAGLIKQFIKTINLFMGHNKQLTEEIQSDLARTLYSLASPVSNNPKDMDFIRTMMIEYANKIRNKLTFESSSTNRKKITSGLYTKSEAQPRTSIFKLEKYFGSSYKGYSNNNISAEIVNASLDPNYGYEYFEFAESTSAGLQAYNASDLTKRAQIETLRYYSSENPTLNLKVNEKIYSNRDFVSSNRYQYFAPSFVSLGGNKKVNLIDEEDNIFNKNKNVALLLDIMGYSMSHVENNMTDYSKHTYSEKLDSYLTFRDINRITNKSLERDLESANFIPADTYFGRTTKIIVDKDISDDQELIDILNRESNNKFSSRSNNVRKMSESNIAGNGVMLSLIGAHYLKTLEPIKDLERWNLRNPENIIAFLDNVKSDSTIKAEVINTDQDSKLQKRPANHVSPEKQKIIKEMPMQLKSLLHQGVSNVVKNNFRKELFSSNFNPLQDASKFVMFWLLHGQLVELQAYVGHNLTNNDTSIKEPTWRPVSADVWSTIINRNATLCRVVRYKNPMLLGTYPEALNLPIYNEYFLIKGDSISPAKGSKIKTRVTKKIEKLINNSDKLYNEGVQPEYMFNSQIRSGRSNVERKNRPRPTTPLSRDRKVGSTTAQSSPQRVASPQGTGMSPGTTTPGSGGSY
jgi:ribosome-associated translation inhibitor RaiA